jgi:hypothetical protein
MASATSSFLREILIVGSTRGKLYSIKHDASSVTTSISPGAGYNNPLGAYIAYETTTTAGEYAFSITAGKASSASRILFLQ